MVREKDLFNDKVEIPAWTLIEIQRAFKVLRDDKSSYLHRVFSDDRVFEAINIWNDLYNDYFEKTGGFLK